MTLEAALLSALTVVSGCLSWAVKALYERLISAERTVIELRAKIEELVKDAADKGAKLEMVKQCQQQQGLLKQHLMWQVVQEQPKRFWELLALLVAWLVWLLCLALSTKNNKLKLHCKLVVNLPVKLRLVRMPCTVVLVA